MAVVNGYAALGRPVDQGFAVVKLEDLPDVHVTVNNAGVGTTNGHGTLLLPSLLPYYGNTVALVTEDIPVDRSLEAITKLAVPPLHGGALVEFRAPRVRGLQGTIHPTVPDLPTDFGPGAISLTVNDKPIEAVVGRHGEFYLEDIPPGDHDLTVEFPNLTCHVHLQVPDTAESLRSLGELPCVPAH
jgi:outer membrane usher protein